MNDAREGLRSLAEELESATGRAHYTSDRVARLFVALSAGEGR